jgi:gamma-glutamyl-gamma-aminobutyrate hydrolase PuuD
MKKILITQRIDSAIEYQEERSGLDINWGELMSTIQLLPIALLYSYDFKNYFDAFEIDGVIFTGGNDLNYLSPNTTSKTRNEFEIKLLEYCLENGTPIFGVCHGMQIIASHFGSELKMVEDHVAKAHNLNHTNSSLFVDGLEQLQTVNSYHKYGFNKVSENFRVLARSPDGVIEAIEHKHYRIYCQMWHPERKLSHSNINEKILKSFFNKVLK